MSAPAHKQTDPAKAPGQIVNPVGEPAPGTLAEYVAQQRVADNTTLGLKMHNRANHDRLPTNHPMRTAAQKFGQACEGYFAEPQTVQAPEFLRAWTGARLAWCRYTGEPLL